MFIDSHLVFNNALCNKKAICSHIKAQVQSVNNCGGWYVSGWYKQGLNEVDTDVKGQNLGNST
jgi:hypothetical protein